MKRRRTGSGGMKKTAVRRGFERKKEKQANVYDIRSKPR